MYINGWPFVLRDEIRPLKNLQEYSGIDAARIESMEDRLRDDILAEVSPAYLSFPPLLVVGLGG